MTNGIQPGRSIDCVLECRSSAEHLGQIFSGFAALERRGLVRVTLRRAAGYSGHIFGLPLIHAVLSTPALAAPLRVTFDTSDACAVPDDLYGSRFYFMRSYQHEALKGHRHQDRIFPLGLNYGIFTKDAFALRRALWTRNLGEAARILAIHNLTLSRFLRIQNSVNTCDPSCFEALPIDDDDPQIIFMTQTWVPTRVSDGPHRQERFEINSMRAACIRALRKEFSNRFVGGFVPSPYAREHFPDCLVPDAGMTRKTRYLSAVHASSIGIATRGLAGSTGWKLAEYVAAAKAIVTEPLLSQVPGDFALGRNYLEFTNAQECVEQVTHLVRDRERRKEMLWANYVYYQCYVRPDVLVWNALCAAISRARAADGVEMTQATATGR